MRRSSNFRNVPTGIPVTKYIVFRIFSYKSCRPCKTFMQRILTKKKETKFILSKSARSDDHSANKTFDALIRVAKDVSWDKGKYKPFTISQVESAVKKDKAKFSGETVDSGEYKYNPSFYKKLLETVTPFFKSRFVASMFLSKCLKSAKKTKGKERKRRIKACERKSSGDTKSKPKKPGTSKKSSKSTGDTSSVKSKVNTTVNAVYKCRKKAESKETRSGKKKAKKKCKSACIRYANDVGTKTKKHKMVKKNILELCNSADIKVPKSKRRCQKRVILKASTKDIKKKLKSCAKD